LGAQSCLWLSLRTSILKKIHLGPQNGPGSQNLLKIVNCQNGQKIVLSHLEKVGGHRYPPGLVQDPKYRFPLKNDTSHSLLYPNLDDLKILQMSLDHEFLKLEPKEKRLTRIVNVSDVDLKDHQQDHQLLLVLNGPI
jgi:hypothetical protein